MEWLGMVADRSLLLLGATLLVMVLTAKEVGYLFARHWPPPQDRSEVELAGVRLITGGILTLLAFLIAISFSIADQRYDERRNVVLAEANAIGTAWLRAEAQDSDAGRALQRLLTDYAEIRLQALRTSTTLVPVLERTAALQNELWTTASGIARAAPTPLSVQLLASLNEVFDLALSQRRALESRVPPHILRLMLTTSLLAIAGLGYHLGMLGSRQFMMSNILVLIWVSVMVLIVDISRPDEGFVKQSVKPMIWTLEQLRVAPA